MKYVHISIYFNFFHEKDHYVKPYNTGYSRLSHIPYRKFPRTVLTLAKGNLHLSRYAVSARLQEEANEISLYEFSKMSPWGEITSTKSGDESILKSVDFQLK
jgi:hypothetical protein